MREQLWRGGSGEGRKGKAEERRKKGEKFEGEEQWRS